MSENTLLDEIKEVVAKVPVGQDPKTGCFLPGNKMAQNNNGSPGKAVQSYIFRRLIEAEAEGRAHLATMVDNLIAIAEDPSPKTRKEAIWAWNALMDRAVGSPAKSEEELDAMRQSGVQIAIVQLPGQAAPQIACSQPKALIAPEYDPET